MNTRSRIAVAALAVAATLTATGCAVSRGQQTMGGYVDDSAITAQVKSGFVSNKNVAAASIKVETLQGVVMLSGFAKSENEKASAETVAKNVKGVKSVENQIVVQP